jgi:16S rRNA processing protein RimM
VEQLPADLVAVGRILAAWGLRGALKIMPYAHDGAALLEVRQWWIERAGQWESVDVLTSKTHGEVITATLVGYSERTVAERLKGVEVWIARSRFPVLSDDEHYWVDLIGLDVVNVEGATLGVVHALMDNGAHAILEVQRGKAGASARSDRANLLIPFVERYVKAVDRERSRIVVEWGPEYEE